MKHLLYLPVALALASCAATAQKVEQTPACRFLYSVPGTESAYPVFSKDGKRALFQTDASGKWQLAILDLDTKKATPVMTDTSRNYFPHWNTNNDWIAFVSDRTGDEEVYLMRADGSGLSCISKNRARDIHPYFSPDGRYILYNSDREGTLDVYRYEIGTGKTERLTDAPDTDETCAKYLPGMRKIMYLKNGATDDIYMMDVKTGKHANLTNTPTAGNGWPTYSPDGKWIYYSSFEKKAFHIFRCRVDGTGVEPITFARPGEEDARATIAPDGKRMLYNKRVGKTIEVWVCELS